MSGKLLNINVDGSNVNIFIAGFGIIIVAAIVVGSIWITLRQAALNCKRDATASHPASEEQKLDLASVDVWPIGWISLNRLVALIFVIVLSMFVINTIAFITALFLAVSLTFLATHMKDSTLAYFRRRD